jgi:hypothetical protein
VRFWLLLINVSGALYTASSGNVNLFLGEKAEIRTTGGAGVWFAFFFLPRFTGF